MDFGLNGKTVMISGASKGIGFAIASALAAEGANLSLCARSEAGLVDASSRLEAAYGVDCLSFVGDLSSEEVIETWVRQTEEKFGGIDVLINNAGAALPGAFSQQSDDVWKDGLEVKPFGYIRAARAALKSLKASRGSIVNIIGLAGHQPIPNFMIGGAGDAVLMNFTKGLANELAKDGVRVNAVSPGFTQTENWDLIVLGAGAMMGAKPEDAEATLLSTMPMGRPAQPAEIANVVTFLASTAASYITGVTVPVDGGATHGI